MSKPYQHFIASALAPLFLSACGGGGDSTLQTASPTATSEQPEDQQPTVEAVSFIQRSSSGVLSTNQVQNTEVVNASGTIAHPRDGQSLQGNIILSADVEDADGISLVAMGFPNTNSGVVLCSSNCGTSFHRTLTGLNPNSLGQSNGNLRMELLVEDSLGNRTIVDAASFSWQSVAVNNVTAERSTNNIDVSWSPISGYLRYNLYIAQSPDLTPSNVLSLPGGQAFRALSGTSQAVNGLPDDQVVYALITGVDGGGESAFSQTLRVKALENINNEDPTAVADSFTGAEDTLLSGNVLDNDSDPENNPLIVNTTPLTPPAHGSLSLSENGSFSYQPNNNFFGNDQFVYEITDGNDGVASTTVSLIITAVNDAPQANDDSFNFDEDVELTIPSPGLLGNDSDIDGDELTVNTAPVTEPTSGSLSLGSDGSFIYIPNSNFNGTDSFSYSTEDGNGASSVATVSLTINAINDPPQAANDDYQGLEDQTLVVDGSEFPGILENDTDADKETLSLSITSGVQHGLLNLANNGTFTYIPEENFSGIDQFNYQITDAQGESASAVVTITIVPQNDPPIANNDQYQTAEDQTLTVAAANGLLANDTDQEEDPLVVDNFSAASNGQVSVASDGSFSYTPNDDFNGSDTFSYQVSDGNQGTATAVVTISVSAVNDLPVANNDQASTPEDTPVSINVLNNDIDPENGPLTIINASTTTGTVDIVNGVSLFYSPPSNFNGTASISYGIADTDGQTAAAVVTVSVIAVNDPPVATDDTASTLLNTSVTVNVLGNDTDVEGDSLSVTSASADEGTVVIESDFSLTYTPSSGFTGTDTINYSVTDGNGGADTASVTISVNAESGNTAPEANNDTAMTNINTSVSINVLANDTDADNDQLTVTSASAVNGATNVEPDNTITYTPNTGFTGTDTLTYSITDGNDGTSSATVAITVSASNSAPVANNDTATTNKNAAVNINVLANDDDADDDTLTVTTASATNGGTVIESDNSITYTPNTNYTGSDTITYSISDGKGGTDSATVNITVNETNSPPVASADSYILTSESGTSINIAANVGLLSNDSDADGDDMQAMVDTPPSHSAYFNLNSDGSFQYEHDGSNNLTDSFTYYVQEYVETPGQYQQQSTLSQTVSSSVTVSLTLHKANHPPQLCTPPPIAYRAGQTLTYTLEAEDYNEDPITFSASNLPSWASLNSSTGVLTGAPSVSDVGQTTNISFNVSDGKDTVASPQYSFTVYDEFGTGDQVALDFNGASGIDTVEAIARDNYGSILIGGSVAGDAAIAKLLADGSLDTSFSNGDGDGVDGVYIYDTGHTNDVVTALAIDKNNDVFAAVHGSGISTDLDFVVVKLDDNGTLDTSFNSGGIASVDIGNYTGFASNSNDQVTDLLLHDNGLVTLVGHYDTESAVGFDIVAVQFKADGTLNSAFGTSGVLSHTPASDSVASTKDPSNVSMSMHDSQMFNPASSSSVPNQFIYQGLLDNEGHIYLTGYAGNGTDKDLYIARIKGNDWDSEFAVDGFYQLDAGGDEFAHDIIFDGKGNLMLAGAKDNDFALFNFTVSYNSGGPSWDIAPNISFGSSGKLIVDSTGTDIGNRIISDKRGNFYLVGKADVGGTVSTAVIKLSADGTLVNSFGSSGLYLNNLTSGSASQYARAIIDASGQLMTADTDNNDIEIISHVLTTAPAFGTCELTKTSSDTVQTNDTLVDVVEGAASDFYAVGNSIAPDDGYQDIVIFKFKDGSADNGFGNEGLMRYDAGLTSNITASKIAVTSANDLLIAGYEGTDNLYLLKFNVSGNLDESFDSDGVRDFGGDISLIPSAIHVNSSDEIYIGGTQTSGKAAIVKLLSNGNSDSSFNGDGLADYSDTNFTALDMTVISDGSVYLAGHYFNGSDYEAALLKYSASGTLDTNFGVSGMLRIDPGESVKGMAVTQRNDEIFLLSAASSGTTAYIHMLDSNGDLDIDFGSSGEVTLSNYNAGTNADIQFDNSNNIWLLVESYTSGEAEILKFDINGNPRSNFINGGRYFLTHGLDSWTTIKGIAQESTGEVMVYGTSDSDFVFSHMDQSGKIINKEQLLSVDFGFGDHAFQLALDEFSRPTLVGSRYNSSSNDTDFAIVRFDHSGNSDTSLTGSSAISWLDAGEDESYRALTLTANNKLQVTGETVLSSTPSDINISGERLLKGDFTADDSFGSSGNIYLDISGSGSTDTVSDQYLSTSGDLYIVGSNNGQGSIVKYDKDGNLDLCFNDAGCSSGGIFTLSIGDSSALHAITMDAKGNLIAVGESTSSGNTDPLIVSLNSDGTYNTSFNTTGLYNDGYVDNIRYLDVSIGADGYIFIAGQANHNQAAITKFSPAGNYVDASYFVYSGNAEATAIAIDSYGGIFMGGTAENKFFLYRFDQQLNILRSGTDGREPGTINKARDIKIDSLGNVYMTGSMQYYGEWVFTVLRYPLAVAPY